jgi:hypothetical protein
MVSKNKSTTLEKIDIFMACEETLNNVLKIIDLPLDSQKITHAKYPVFNNFSSHRVRGLIAVGLGCDVNLHLIVTPNNMMKFIDSPMIKNVSEDDAYYVIKIFLFINIIKNPISV